MVNWLNRRVVNLLSLNIVHQFYVGFRKVDKFFPLVFLALCIIFFLGNYWLNNFWLFADFRLLWRIFMVFGFGLF